MEEIKLLSGMPSAELNDAVKTSAMLTEANVKLIGDHATVCQTVQLLAYIRHALRNGQKTKFSVELCGKVADGKLMFDVNGVEIPDLIPPARIEID